MTQLIGIVQGGLRCGDPNRPGIFINLEHPEVISFVRTQLRGK